MKIDVERITGEIRNMSPLIHCITNPISITQCANAVLCLGAKPIMAEHPKEVLEITGTSDALLLNLGNITDIRMKAMTISANAAKEQNIPIILDAVGVACSALRRNFAIGLIQSTNPDVIKGNYSEIYALYNEKYKSGGVDADLSLDRAFMSGVSVELAKKYNCIVIASGKTDIVTDGTRLFYINNGSSQLARVTGTGCMLGSICACCMAVSRDITAAVGACAILGVCGAVAETEKGNGSFMINLMDALSCLEKVGINKYMEVEEIEKF